MPLVPSFGVLTKCIHTDADSNTFALIYKCGFGLFTPIVCTDLLVEMYMLQRLSQASRHALSFFHTCMMTSNLCIRE